MEDNPGIMKNHSNPGKFIEGRNERLYFPVVEGFKRLLSRTGREVAGNPQYKTDFRHGL
jgi:hypothetical protein